MFLSPSAACEPTAVRIIGNNDFENSTAALSPLTCYYQNVRGLRTKLTDFYVSASGSLYDCIILTETWLDDCIGSSQLFTDEYCVYRCDRNATNSFKSGGGGVLIAIKRTLPSSLLADAMDDSLEQLWIRVNCGNFFLVLGAIYIPPYESFNVNVIERHIASIQKASESTSLNDELILFGDYNQRNLAWSKHPTDNHLFVDALRSSINSNNTRLLDGFALHGLYQMNHVTNSNGRILDLVLVNQRAKEHCLVEPSSESLSKIDTHHPPLVISIDRHSDRVFVDEIDIDALDFRRADFEAITRRLRSHDWTQLYECGNIDVASSIFCETVCQFIQEFVPRIRPRQKPVWGNNSLRRLKRQRSSAHSIYRKNRSRVNKITFKFACRRYKALNTSLYRRYTKNVERSLRSNPKFFWRFVNSKRNENGLPGSVFLADKECSCSGSKCELFAQHFRSVFNTSLPEDLEALANVPSDQFNADLFVVTENDIVEAVRKLKLSYCPGPDGIPAVLLKKCYTVLKEPLAFLFNLSFSTSTFPVCWKAAFMFPIFKNGEKRNVENYRGISSLCACSKIFERIVHKHLLFRVKNYISTAQHGFYPGRSVSTNLLEFSSHCLRNMDLRLQTDVVYTDLKAAFDRVDHSLLLSKLDRLGASTNLVNWLRSYLCNRKIAVKIGASSSDWFTNSSGVPQGSTLGPLLFSVFINDLTFLLPAGSRILYADDVKIYIVVYTLDDCHRLQSLLDMFADWCRLNKLSLSIPKCSVISFHRKKEPLTFSYTLEGHTIQRTNCVKDLGVFLDEKLTFHQHYNHIACKANKCLGSMFKVASDFTDPRTLRTLFCALVRSNLEACSVVWDPHQNVWIERIERIQKRFIRRAFPWRDPSDPPRYEERCLLVGLETLTERRKKAKADMTHKLLTGVYDAPNILSLLQLYCPRRPQRHHNFLHLDRHRTNYGLNEPIRGLAMEYNRRHHNFHF